MTRFRSMIKYLLLALAVGGSGYLGFQALSGRTVSNESAQVFTVTKRTITDTVVERGTIESQNTTIGVCNLPGYQNKIISIVPEGTVVAKDDLVVQFDSTDIDRMINEKSIALNEAEGKLAQAEEELGIQQNKNQSEIAAAELALELARLDRDKYLQGDYLVEQADFEQGILESEAELGKMQDELKNVRAMVSKGFRSPDQIRELELRVNQFESRLVRDRQKLKVLQEFDFRRKKTELEANADEAERKLERSKTTAAAEERKAHAAIANAKNGVELVQQELEELKEVKQNCEIKAPQPGTVAYANMPWYDPEDRIREGATIRRQQNVFYLPDMTRMQIKLQVHESVVTKVKAEQTAKIRVDAFPDASLTGSLSYVADLVQSSWSDSKAYETLVLIDSFPSDLSLRPGMTAQVEILIGNFPDVIAVPLSGVTEHLGQTYVYVQSGLTPERRLVKTGRVTHAFVEIVSGLEVGERIFLDAYQRGLKDFQEIETEPTLEAKPEAPVMEM
ncbi:MAG: efflux RND transporter periplasmic adaptor subunit [Pirellulaceae bacterium]|nr:efflux RND transporter periplasmic adaptor subunit [Pirellulaceae bacterium]